MALDKAIASGKEHRKEYRKIAQRVDMTCRCHGGCLWCLSNRIHKYEKKKYDWKKEVDNYDED